MPTTPTILLTGATSDIGRATARRLSASGARLALTARNAEALAAFARTLPGEPCVVAGDVRDDAALKRLVHEAVSRLGPLDGLFLNAGVAPFQGLEGVTRASFRECLEVNVVSALALVQAAAPHLSPGASVVLTASAMHHRPLREACEWVASTWAVRGLAAALAVELGPRGVRVNALSHGPIDTRTYERYGMPTEAVAGVKAALARGTVLGRLGTADEVAEAAALLLRPGYMTGSELVVDGGWALTAAEAST
jgi:NAD(P)-dependent dehydrogenase (short-subunit alcohol dehydrogenase family)